MGYQTYDQAKSINSKCILNYFLSALHIFMRLLKGSLDACSDEQGKLNCFPLSFLFPSPWQSDVLWLEITKCLLKISEVDNRIGLNGPFSKGCFFFSYSETEKLVGVFFSPMKYYSATERLCLPNGKSFMLIQDKTSKVYDFPTVSLWCSHIIFALPYWGIKHIGRWWCVLVSGLLLDVSSQKLAAAQALCPLTLLGVQPHICLGCSCGNWFQNTLLHLSSPP